MPARRIECPAPDCDWRSQTFTGPKQFPFNCPECGCPIFKYADEYPEQETVKLSRYKVYSFDKPSKFVVVEWPDYSPMAIKGEAIKTSDVFDWKDYESLRVRRASENL